MNMNDIDHFIVTRINMGLYSTNPKRYLSTLEAKNKWMNGKLKAARKYLLPSIKYQINKDFKVIWIVDDKTPENFLIDIQEQAKEIEATIIFDKWLTNRNIGEGNCLDGDWLEKFKLLITKELVAITRYDSDDILSKDFIDTVKKYLEEKTPPVCIDFWYRLSRSDSGKLFLVRCIPEKKPGWCTPTVTLLEETKNFKSPFLGSHFKLGKIFPVKVYSDIVWCKTEKNPPHFIHQYEEEKLEYIKGFEGIGF